MAAPFVAGVAALCLEKYPNASPSVVTQTILSQATIDAYVASGEPFGKAGAYAIQSALAGWIERIDGSHSGIMGLPLFETAQLLHRARVATALTP